MTDNNHELIAEYTRFRDDINSIVIEVASINWALPNEPKVTWSAVSKVPLGSSPEVIQIARQKALERRKYFATCSECGERMAKGHMLDAHICQACATKNHGVVF